MSSIWAGPPRHRPHRRTRCIAEANGHGPGHAAKEEVLSRRGTARRAGVIAGLPRFRSFLTVPEVVHGAVVAEEVGAELEDGLGPLLGPELLGALDPVVDAFDLGLDVTRGDGQAVAPVFVVLHPPLL